MSVRIDASGDKLSRTASLPTNAAYTVALWWYYVAAPGVGAYFLSVENAAVSSSAYHLLGFNAAGSFRIVTNGGATNFAADPATGEWHFIAMKSDGVDLTAYHRTLAGVWQSATRAATTFTNNAIILGANSYDEWVSCRIAAVKVWDAVLTQAEIEQEATTIRPVRFTNLNLFSPCFPGATERLRDYSGNGRNWTAGGTLTDEDPPPISWGARSLWLPYAASGSAVYNEAGQGTLIGVASGADTAAFTEAGQATSVGAASGADTFVLAEAGAGVLVGVASGAETTAVAEAGAGVLVGVASGADTAAVTEAGTGVLVGVASAADTTATAEAGQATTVATASGADALVVAEAGQATAIGTASGADTFTAGESGQVLAAWSSGALDTWVMVDAGTGVLGAVASGSDSGSGARPIHLLRSGLQIGLRIGMAE